MPQQATSTPPPGSGRTRTPQNGNAADAADTTPAGPRRTGR
ncbi:hypothetical protein ACFZDK_06930 [Streptomyces sp. NPDC007901]